MRNVLGCAALSTTAATLFLHVTPYTVAFTTSHHGPRPTTTRSARRGCFASSTAARMLRMVPLSNEEIFARAQQAQKQRELDTQEMSAPPMLFDEDMLVDMQAALLLLEERVTGGPGALSLQQVDQLAAQLHKIRTEMKENEHQRPPKPTIIPSTIAAAPVDLPPPPSSSSSEPLRPVATTNSAPQVIDIDTPSEEGEVYNGRGGMGQAADTVNTYIIPGMDEMTAEEYRDALQASVIARQQKRKGSGVTGNRASWDYLNSLTGETGVLKKEESEDDHDDAAEDSDPKKKNFNPFKNNL